jgi:hypothetical protein
MIPKIIHYCWFGGNPLPELAEKCIQSWKKFLPDYEIKEWNEKNFDLDEYLFTREAYDNKKFAYVTDVVRLYALKKEGGIYMDTDVEVLGNLDTFLGNYAFSGFESDMSLPTGIMASIQNGQWVTEMVNYYNDRKFLNSKNKPILTTNVVIISKLMKEKGILLDNTFQEIKGYVTFYPSEYFCPKSPVNGQIKITENTYCIHHFAGSWADPPTQSIIFKQKTINLFKSLFGKNIVEKIYFYYKNK